MLDNDQVLDERQVAKTLHLSVATLRAWRRRGMGPRYLKLNRAVRYLGSDVEVFIASRAVNTARPAPDVVIDRVSA